MTIDFLFFDIEAIYLLITTWTFLSLWYIRISIVLGVESLLLFIKSNCCRTEAIMEYEMIPGMLLLSSANPSFIASILLNSHWISSYVFPSPTNRNGDNRSSLIFLNGFHRSTGLTSSMSTCWFTFIYDWIRGWDRVLKVISTG